MSHCLHHGWEMVPSLIILIVSLIWIFKKLIQRLEQLVDLPGHPSTGESIVLAVRGSPRGTPLEYSVSTLLGLRTGLTGHVVSEY